MQVVRDLAGGGRPAPLELYYNGIYNADCTTKRYKGSLVKVTDAACAVGPFYTWAGTSTLYQSIFGILEEEVGTSGNYMPSHATAAMVTKKITPVLPSSVVRAEYAQKDPAGSATVTSAGTISAASGTFTHTQTSSDYYHSGGWLYFVTGANAGYLHYIEQNSDTDMTLGTVAANAVVTGDTWLLILPSNTQKLKLCDHEVCIDSEGVLGNRTFYCLGLMHYITAPGTPFQRLDRAKHDGLKIANARFYHDFIIGGNDTTGSVWRDTLVVA